MQGDCDDDADDIDDHHVDDHHVDDHHDHDQTDLYSCSGMTPTHWSHQLLVPPKKRKNRPKKKKGKFSPKKNEASKRLLPIWVLSISREQKLYCFGEL